MYRYKEHTRGYPAVRGNVLYGTSSLSFRIPLLEATSGNHYAFSPPTAVMSVGAPVCPEAFHGEIRARNCK